VSENRVGGYTENVATVEQSETTVVTLTARGAEKVSALMAQEPEGEAEVLRIAIQGGGCSGFEYALGFDRGAQAGDVEVEMHGVKVVVDPFSAPYLQGATIDFLETLQESGFKIENPNAVSSCGCGTSFQVAEGEDAPADSGDGCGSCASH
jgi:iron-sulfur cluster assembly protein